MGALKTFASTKYIAYIGYLTLIFVNISEPTLNKLTLASTSEEIVLKDDTKRTITSSTTEELEEYTIKLKEYLKDEKAVKTIKRSLHNVVRGQCSHMLCTKLKGNDELDQIEVDGTVAALLKKIRGYAGR